MKTSLKRLVLGAIAAVSTIAVAVLATFDIIDDMRAARDRVEAHAQRLATVTAPLVLSALVVDDLATVEEALKAANGDGAFARIVLLAPDGKTKILDVSPAQERRSDAPALFRALFDADAGEVRVTVRGGGVVYGTIVFQPAKHLIENEAWARAVWDLVGALVLLVLLLIAIERVVARSLRPISTLAATAARFGQGDFSARLPPSGVVEVRELARAFNAMADNLERALADLSREEIVNRRLAAAVGQADEAIVTVDADGRILTWNRGAECLFGASEGEAIGRPLAEVAKTADGSGDGVFSRLLASGGPAAIELRVARAGMDPIHAEASSTPLAHADGLAQGWVVVVRDISLRKKSERQMFEARRAAELSNRSKSEFLANMSHELRTPLNAIIGFSDMMRSAAFGPLGAPKYREYIEDIHHAGTHLLALINDLLDIAAIEEDKLGLRESRVDLREMAATAARLLRHRTDSGRIAFSWRCDPAIGLLRADSRRIKQILLNLLSNAVKFTPPNGTVTLDMRRVEDGSVDIVVSDNGIGMDEDGIARAFERFGQVDSGLNRKHEGSGLGLPLTQSLVALHGGTLRLESAPGRGTTVTINLPAERVVPQRLELVRAS